MTAAAGFVLRLVDPQLAPSEFVAVQRLNRARRVGLAHFHEAKASGAARLTIGGQGDRFDRAVLREQIPKFRICGREGQVTNVNLSHYFGSLGANG